MYLREVDMYPDIIAWLESDLRGRFGKSAARIQVLDTHDSDLSNFISRLGYQRSFPEFTTYQIRQDITGFIEYADRVDLIFVECKINPLRLIDLSQLIGYSCIALPLYSILLSPQGMGTTLHKLLLSFNRKDVLEFRPHRKIQIIKWDLRRQDADFANSIII